MASRNARNLILLGRSGATSNAAQQLLTELRLGGLTVAAPPCDITDHRALARVLDDCIKAMPPIKGAIIGTMVLKDSSFERMSHSSYQAAVMVKVAGTWNVHSLLPSDLDFFLLLSSMSGMISFSGQSNYASGNAYQDALAHRLVSAGRRAVSIDLGVVASVGWATDHSHRVTELLGKYGFTTVYKEDYLALIEYYCDPARPRPTLRDCQVLNGIGVPADLRGRGLPEVFWMGQPMFRTLQNAPPTNANDVDPNAQATGQRQDNQGRDSDSVEARGRMLQSALSKATTLTEAARIIRLGLTRRLVRLLDLQEGDMDDIGNGTQSVNSYGVDSLVAVELRAWLRVDAGSEVSVFEILGNSPMAAFAEQVAQRSSFVHASVKGEG